MSQGALSPEPPIGPARIEACPHLRHKGQMCCDTTARQAFHLGFQVDFLSDATGTLSLQNSAGSISASELRPGGASDDGAEICEGSGNGGVDKGRMSTN